MTAMAREPKYSRSDWLIPASKLAEDEVIRIQPRESLTAHDVVAALNVQGVSGCRVTQHGSVIWVRRLKNAGANFIAR
jgi:hypothetical protein